MYRPSHDGLRHLFGVQRPLTAAHPGSPVERPESEENRRCHFSSRQAPGHSPRRLAGREIGGREGRGTPFSKAPVLLRRSRSGANGHRGRACLGTAPRGQWPADLAVWVAHAQPIAGLPRRSIRSRAVLPDIWTAREPGDRPIECRSPIEGGSRSEAVHGSPGCTRLSRQATERSVVPALAHARRS